MSKILLDNKEFIFTEDHLPILIHGEDHSGASLYTITLAAHLVASGSKLIFLCGYQMAKNEYVKQVGHMDGTQFFVKEETQEFKEALIKTGDKTIVFVKNVELFDVEIFNIVANRKKAVISGDISKCAFEDKILNKAFNCRVLFSKLNREELPKLNKYEGYLSSTDLQGITALKTLD